jgi:hypothetical protein
MKKLFLLCFTICWASGQIFSTGQRISSESFKNARAPFPLLPAPAASLSWEDFKKKFGHHPSFTFYNPKQDDFRRGVYEQNFKLIQ